MKLFNWFIALWVLTIALLAISELADAAAPDPIAKEMREQTRQLRRIADVLQKGCQ